jgi:hypothetical protein
MRDLPSFTKSRFTLLRLGYALIKKDRWAETVFILFDCLGYRLWGVNVTATLPAIATSKTSINQNNETLPAPPYVHVDSEYDPLYPLVYAPLPSQLKSSSMTSCPR